MPDDSYTCSEPKLPDAPTPDDIFPDDEVLRDAAWAGFYAMCNDMRLVRLYRANAGIKQGMAINKAAVERRSARYQIESARDQLTRMLADLEKAADDRHGQG